MPVPEPRSATARRRALVVAFGVLALLASFTAPAVAAEPIDAREPGPTPRRVYVPPVTPRPTPVTSPAPVPEGTPGYDVSWPQCNDELPELFAFAIVGVNGGRVHSANDCLAAQLAWAGTEADVYINTANPGPHHSEFWPAGQDEPRACDTADARGDDTPDCAYLYGWNAAADSYARALEAFIGLDWADADAERIPGNRTWWLDVETANSWRSDRSLNVASLQGAVDYLESMDAAEIGFYSTPLLWWRVTGGTDAFADYPSWHAGGRTAEQAKHHCDERAFTDGEVRMVQWIEDGIDTNYLCR